MNTSYAEIESAAMALDRESKLRLISGLSLSMRPTDLEKEWCKEVRRRHEAVQQGASSTSPLEAALDDIRAVMDQ